MTRLLTVSETAAFHVDWSAFLDDAAHQDPEVATARGHGAVPLPSGLPSSVPAPEAARLLQGAAVRRVLESEGHLEAGQQVQATLTTGPNSVVTRFVASGFTAQELLETVDPVMLPDLEPGAGAQVFCTSSAVSPTRIRAFAWGLNDLLPEQDVARFDRWGGESEHARVLIAAVLLPTVLSTHVLRRRLPAPGPVRVETLARIDAPRTSSRYVVRHVAGVPDAQTALVVADGGVLACVRLEGGSLPGEAALVGAGSLRR